MLSTESFRACPLGNNTSLNIQRSSGSDSMFSSPSSMNSSYSSNSSSLFGQSVPLDRQLFVNTQMTAQQCVDLYQRAGGASYSTGEPALQMGRF
ncbi:hypothetical protein PENTCL1PPCAC_29435 [Pristionchus entomophagus]|uniref:Uncharacterized protein n=1 Tax=Pristionchus entomophagus TaxID=358040 RepID=A0AAV5UJT5_9BILA|nr:hypothetical protein PENTCL1PPCAC_29435 [Pristionchus entomophagus]